ncbi:methyltransferase domain-containing protein [Lentithecium fluviatile CBS 122367]|uniref:Methyltransferase domain-containing protein n=1 Tax=Lentithecium fluviatile CBS 122367 TaxID=1168545 RepID=A0A6G1J3Y7_9PLEO|nr:methyltransferase domain-containing protein [Lentithecium fluviatile CBS 122367]
MAARHQLSDKAVQGFAKAALYDKHRPSYPPEALAVLLDAAMVSGVEGARIVDLGAGTGKFTEALAAREEHFKIVAIEPHAEMREQLACKSLNNVAVKDGFSTAIPADHSSVDAVFAAQQAFHWFSNEETLKEIHRVLKPGGVLGMVWNAEDYNTSRSYDTATEWSSKLRDYAFSLDDKVDDHEPRFRHDQWRKVFENQLSSTPITAALVGGTNSLFSLPLGQDKVRWSIWLDQEALWNRLRTLSHFAVLEGEGLKEAREVFEAALSEADVQRNAEGQIKVDGATIMAWTSKIPE